jgi:hypothetical protein
MSLFNDLKEALKEMSFLDKGTNMLDEYIQLVILKKLHYEPFKVHESWLQFVEPDVHYDLRKSVFQSNYGLKIGSGLLSGKAAQEIYRNMETPYDEGFYEYIRLALSDMHHIQMSGFIK